MEKVLNRGLNFAVLSGKLDITQVFVDLNRFDRTMIWREYWHCHENEDDYNKPMFKTHNSNLPTKYKVPNGLKTYLNSVIGTLRYAITTVKIYIFKYIFYNNLQQ